MSTQPPPDTPPGPPAPPPLDFGIALAFAPAPSRTNRRDGWTERTQRRFIAVLTATGTVAAAAKAVGMSQASAYNLRRRPGADGFAAAWDDALDLARDRQFQAAMARAVHGVTSQRFYRGRYTGTAHRYDYAAVMAALGKGSGDCVG